MQTTTYTADGFAAPVHALAGTHPLRAVAAFWLAPMAAKAGHAQKRSAMAGGNIDGWPRGPQDRRSG